MHGVSLGAQKLLRSFDLDERFVASHQDHVKKLVSTGLTGIDAVLDMLERRPVVPMRTPHKMPLWVVRPGVVRDYQWFVAKLAMRKSGFIVAPCGSGKTLMGLLLAALNGGRFLILTTRYVGQWKATLGTFFAPQGATRVVVYGEEADRVPCAEPPHAVIATYSAFCSPARTTMNRVLKQLPYETVVLDEAHGAAAPTHLKLVDSLHAKYWYALTATKVREDLELAKLETRVGPTLVDLDRRGLVSRGFVADVTCLHLVVECASVLESVLGRTISLALDPFKMQVMCGALRVLLDQGHRPLVFCDDLFCLHWASRVVKSSGIPVAGVISMKTPNDAREAYIRAFQRNVATSVLFLSRTGDEALDVPEATAGVVFWNHWASRRQIVQRLGRIARLSDGPAPVFLVLLADDPKELENSAHREAYLEDHGFATQRVRQEETPYGMTLRRGVDAYVERLRSAWQAESNRSHRGVDANGV